jgi:hypothetical protein
VIRLFALLALSPALALAMPESWYQERYCTGQTEYVLHDRTRVDCLTETHAIEYDFGTKWHQAIGQSLGYAFETNKRAGIVLILNKPKDYKFWLKLNSVIENYKLPIDTWLIRGWEDRP